MAYDEDLLRRLYDAFNARVIDAVLAVKPGAPAGSARGVFGDDDKAGCINLITEQSSTPTSRAS